MTCFKSIIQNGGETTLHVLVNYSLILLVLGVFHKDHLFTEREREGWRDGGRDGGREREVREGGGGGWGWGGGGGIEEKE